MGCCCQSGKKTIKKVQENRVKELRKLAKPGLKKTPPKSASASASAWWANCIPCYDIEPPTKKEELKAAVLGKVTSVIDGDVANIFLERAMYGKSVKTQNQIITNILSIEDSDLKIIWYNLNAIIDKELGDSFAEIEWVNDNLAPCCGTATPTLETMKNRATADALVGLVKGTENLKDLCSKLMEDDDDLDSTKVFELTHGITLEEAESSIKTEKLDPNGTMKNNQAKKILVSLVPGLEIQADGLYKVNDNDLSDIVYVSSGTGGGSDVMTATLKAIKLTDACNQLGIEPPKIVVGNAIDPAYKDPSVKTGKPIEQLGIIECNEDYFRNLGQIDGKSSKPEYGTLAKEAAALHIIKNLRKKPRYRNIQQRILGISCSKHSSAVDIAGLQVILFDDLTKVFGDDFSKVIFTLIDTGADAYTGETFDKNQKTGNRDVNSMRILALLDKMGIKTSKACWAPGSDEEFTPFDSLMLVIKHALNSKTDITAIENMCTETMKGNTQHYLDLIKDNGKGTIGRAINDDTEQEYPDLPYTLESLWYKYIFNMDRMPKTKEFKDAREFVKGETGLTLEGLTKLFLVLIPKN